MAWIFFAYGILNVLILFLLHQLLKHKTFDLNTSYKGYVVGILILALLFLMAFIWVFLLYANQYPLDTVGDFIKFIS